MFTQDRNTAHQQEASGLTNPVLDGTALGRHLKNTSTHNWQGMLCAALRISQQDLPLPPPDISNISKVGYHMQTSASTVSGIFGKVQFKTFWRTQGCIKRHFFPCSVPISGVKTGGSSQGSHETCSAQSKAECRAAPQKCSYATDLPPWDNRAGQGIASNKPAAIGAWSPSRKYSQIPFLANSLCSQEFCPLREFSICSLVGMTFVWQALQMPWMKLFSKHLSGVHLWRV